MKDIYKWQTNAVSRMLKNKVNILMSPTASGKTKVYIDTFLALREENQKLRLVIGVPIKALANNKYYELCEQFGKDNICIMTGDVSIGNIRRAMIIICTQEIYLSDVFDNIPHMSVIDEVHYMFDSSRMLTYCESIEKSVSNAVKTIMVSATISNDEVVHMKNIARCDVNCHVNKKFPKTWEYANFDDIYHRDIFTNRIEYYEDKIQFPILGIAFSYSVVEDISDDMNNLFESKWLHRERCNQIIKEFGVHLKTEPFMTYTGNLLPSEKSCIEQMMRENLLLGIVGTDAIAYGVNYSFGSVIFYRDKNEGISGKMFNQISGRCGRPGMTDYIGKIYNLPSISNKMSSYIQPISEAYIAKRLIDFDQLGIIEQLPEDKCDAIQELSLGDYYANLVHSNEINLTNIHELITSTNMSLLRKIITDDLDVESQVIMLNALLHGDMNSLFNFINPQRVTYSNYEEYEEEYEEDEEVDENPSDDSRSRNIYISQGNKLSTITVYRSFIRRYIKTAGRKYPTNIAKRADKILTQAIRRADKLCS